MLFQSFLTIKVDSAAAWQMWTGISWWPTTWTAATAGCWRSSAANCAALGVERKPPAPWTASRTRRRHGMRCRGFSRRQLDPRAEKRLNPNPWNPGVQARPPLYRMKTHPEPNRPSPPWRQNKLLLKKYPATRCFSRSVTGMTSQTLTTMSGGLGKAVVVGLHVYNCTV